MSTKIKEFFFKPKWEHKNAPVRAQAVATSQDPRLIALLPVMTIEDADPSVRLHAMRRVSDLEVLFKAAFDDSDESVRNATAKRLVSLLCDKNQTDPEKSVDIVRRIEDLGIQETVVQRAALARLRAAALPHIQRQGLLGDIAINDPDSDIRTAALVRIEQLSTIERVAKAARKKDKKLFRRATELLNERRLEEGDADVSESLGEDICDAMRSLALDSNISLADKRKQLNSLKQRWEALTGPVANSLQERYGNACEVIENELDPKPVPQREPDLPSQQTPQEAEPEAQAATAEDSDEKTLLLRNLVDRASRTAGRSGRGINALATHVEKIWQSIDAPTQAQRDLKSQFDNTLQESRETVRINEEKVDAAKVAVVTHLDTLEQATEDGDLATARAALADLMKKLDVLGRQKSEVMDQDFRFRMTAARGKLGELREWQRWSNDKIRDRLCQEAAEIAQQQLHPDAVVEKIKALQSQWRTLADSEKLHGERGHHNHSQYRQFRKACNTAFELAKPYFEKRAEVREKHQAEMEALCESIEGLPEMVEGGDWRNIMRTIIKGRRAFKDLDNIPPKARSKVANRLRTALDAMEPHLQARSRKVSAAKRALVREAEALVELEDQQAAAQRAKEIQREWQASDRADRATEQKLWKAFRAACDQIFARLDEQREQDRSEQDALLAKQDALCSEVETLITLDDADAPGRWHEISRLQSAWNELGVRRSPLERRFATALAEARQAHALWIEKQARAARQRNWEILDICVAAEAQRISEAEFDERVAGLVDSNTIPDALQARIAVTRKALAGDPIAEEQLQENLDKALTLCIQAEFIAGIETPQTYQQQRMDYQVQRLSEQMGSGQAKPDAKAEGEALQLAWLANGPLGPEHAEEVTARFSAALRSVFEDDYA